jgi:hypothetical protein
MITTVAETAAAETSTTLVSSSGCREALRFSSH